VILLGVPKTMSSRPRPSVLLALTVLIVLALAGTATAQRVEDEVLKQLRVEWETPEEAWTRPRIVGHVYNDSAYRLGSLRLRVEVLDASKEVIHKELAWIYVNVPARGRASFSVRRPTGEAYRLTVESFVLIAREAPSENP
jgi:hypothetical protein